MPKGGKRRKKNECNAENLDPAKCCKVEKNSKNRKSDGRNCYSIECCDEKLIESQECLQTLIDCKRQLEHELDKSLDEIKCLNDRIAELECKIEKLVATQAAKECQKRMKEEICMIKQEKRKTEADLKTYRKQLCEKLERLKRCGGGNDECDE